MAAERTIFNTPLLTPCLRAISKLLLRLLGWKINGPRPTVAKCVICAGPHTSNWDFAYFLIVVFGAEMKVNWMGKHTLFPPGLGWFMRWLGGVAVDRHRAGGVVAEMTRHYQRMNHLHLLVTPEGTRAAVRKWKTGFYRIAQTAKVPVVPVTVDFSAREVLFHSQVDPDRDVEDGVAAIQALFTNISGLKSQGQWTDT